MPIKESFHKAHFYYLRSLSRLPNREYLWLRVRCRERKEERDKLGVFKLGHLRSILMINHKVLKFTTTHWNSSFVITLYLAHMHLFIYVVLWFNNTPSLKMKKFLWQAEEDAFSHSHHENNFFFRFFLSLFHYELTER
jgi:hypothetical protein